MHASESFLDSSTLLYLVSADQRKAGRVEQLLEQRSVISVQVLNEFFAVASGKFGMPPAHVAETLAAVRSCCRVTDLTVADHDLAIEVVSRYRFSFYDSLIVAAALHAGCTTLYAEDLQHGQQLRNGLKIVNPFR
jgi:predicted nucleic acid-binding protein